jgi:hypothetical protein
MTRPNNPAPGYFPDSGILFPVWAEKFPITTPREFARNRLILIGCVFAQVRPIQKIPG